MAKPIFCFEAANRRRAISGLRPEVVLEFVFSYATKGSSACPRTFAASSGATLSFTDLDLLDFDLNSMNNPSPFAPANTTNI